jgi:DNA polymerase (family 10)
LRQLAQKKDLKVNEYGIFSVKGGREKFLAGRTEEECFRTLGLPYVPPEIREELGEDEVLKLKKTPALIELGDIKGEFHTHSTYSDGRSSIEDMAEAARGLGYEYLAVSDHSPKLRVAGGVSPENLKKKKKEIDALNKRYKGFRILFGAEVEIDSEGNLDYNEAVLSGFDIVIAAVHSGFEQGEEKLTRRLISAIKNRRVNIIAHPTGVHLGKREPYPLDFKQIFQAAADYNVFLEINAFPIRLDLNSANVYHAKKAGVKFAINTDAHHVDHLKHMPFGVAIARRGWLTREDVLNTRGLKEVEKQLEK